MSSQEAMQLQLWVLGGVIITLLSLLIFFVRNAFDEMKMMIKQNTKDIIRIDNQVQLQGQTINRNKDFEQIMTILRAMGSGEPINP